MVSAALTPRGSTGQKVTADWVAQTATVVVAEVEQRRSTWQVWHLRSEAQRQVRVADIPAKQVETVVAFVVDEALARSIKLATDRDPIAEPASLRRTDGSCVYHVAGSDLFTSERILAAEARIVASAGHFDGRRIMSKTVGIALLESAANGTELNAGQAALVHGTAASGARVQLGIAAAGTGKTTAMSVLTRAWEEGGGNVVGLAPSAAAAAALRDQTGATTDTLAKLIHAIESGSEDQIPGHIGAGTLVLIDEAGMADTLTLDTAIGFILERGASVRVIGDDQQLAAIGAGGVLRDIDAAHGALRLAELMRFADPAEGAATLALRQGSPEALGFYLDRQRVHVGDLATLIDDVFTSWQADRTAGRDSIMLAPTRELVCELNARARTARLANADGQAGMAVRLTDGNMASVGDVVITRNNDRRLRVSATDWVKNGDRWHVTDVDGGRLNVQHTGSGLRVVLPAAYVAGHTELGYASTVHTAQGVSVDTTHGLATGDETRQQFYTMMTRGRHSNDVYLVVTGDGDPHSLIRPETIHPKTATDVLEDILGRDGSPRSATTMGREAAEPAQLLGQAAARYDDALYASAEILIGPERTNAIERSAKKLISGITDEPAWPVLHAHLILIEAQGHDAPHELACAVAGRDLDGVRDRAAILDWRLDPTGLRGPTDLGGSAVGPLPWMPAIPAALAADPIWRPYLAARAGRVESLVVQVRDGAVQAETPVWARQGGARPTPDVLADIAVWRAATGVAADDRRPTGPPQLQKATAAHQRRLNERVNVGRAPALAEWGPTIDSLCPRRDEFSALLAERLAAISRSDVNAAGLFRLAASEGPLPDDHAAAALWWRISRHLSPTVATEATGRDVQITTGWSGLLLDTLGAGDAARLTKSPWWPTLVASVDNAMGRGWAITDLIDIATTIEVSGVEPAQAMVWRIAIITDPPPEADPYELDTPPEDLDEAFPIVDATVIHTNPSASSLADLDKAAIDRELLDPLEPTDADIARLLDRAYEWDHAPVIGPRILVINEMAAKYYERELPGSWAHTHLRMRFGQDLAGDERFRPGYAPAGWTTLVTHLRGRGVSDDEMVAAGLAMTASTGRLINRFRDRAMLPIMSDGQVLGFVGRRHPDGPNNSKTDETKAGPKYLNTPTTIVFHKGAQLYGIGSPQMVAGAIPVLMEGPMDAIAVTLATGGAYVGLAPLGTSLTDEQAAELGRFGVDPIVATDGDLAGRIAAERDYWLLTPHGLDPKFAHLGVGEDPASLLAHHGPSVLRAALHDAGPLAVVLIDERINNLDSSTEQLNEIAQIVAARPLSHWGEAIDTVADQLSVPVGAVEKAVLDAAGQWNGDRRRAGRNQLAKSSAVRARIETAATAEPADRWAKLAFSLDPRLVGQSDWPATAAMLQEIHDAGHDVRALTRQLLNHTPLGEAPAQDLRYRLVGYLPDQNGISYRTSNEEPLTEAAQQHQHMAHLERRPDVGPRR